MRNASLPGGLPTKNLAQTSQALKVQSFFVTFGSLSINSPRMEGTLDHGFATPAFTGLAFIGCPYVCIISQKEEPKDHCSLQLVFNQTLRPCIGALYV